MDARSRWSRLETSRSSLLKRVETCSKLTIPGLLPPQGHVEGSPLPTPYQSLGSRGVNNLASKLLMAILPPGQSAFRLEITGEVRRDLEAQKLVAEAEARLASFEQAAARRIEASNARPVMFEVLKHLIVTGNALVRYEDGALKMWRLDQYVASRNPDGTVAEVVVKESVNSETLRPEVRAAAKLAPDHKQLVDVFTVITFGDRVEEWQEINGEVIPGSEGSWAKGAAPWMVLRWTSVPSHNYGRGLCEEYLGDLMTLEGLTESITRFAAAAAKIVHLVRPGSLTKFADFVKARSGDAITGNADDISTVQLQKYADFQVAKAVVDDVGLRLSHAFLLHTGTVRNAERVTAEEIRQMAQELEDALGGVYSVLASELQRPFIQLTLADMRANGLMPKLPGVDPVIVTGFEALGRNHEVNRLRAWLADVMTYDPQLETVNKAKVSKRLGTGHSVADLDELLVSEEDIAASRQQAMQAEAMSRAAPAVAGAVAKAATA
jgi:hypothetical protein